MLLNMFVDFFIEKIFWRLPRKIRSRRLGFIFCTLFFLLKQLAICFCALKVLFCRVYVVSIMETASIATIPRSSSASPVKCSSFCFALSVFTFCFLCLVGRHSLDSCTRKVAICICFQGLPCGSKTLSWEFPSLLNDRI